jgi:hypothetical protein
VRAALTDQILIRKGKIWTERPRIDHVATFQASAPKVFKVADLIVVAVAGSAVIAPAAAASEDLAGAVIDSEAVASVAGAVLADSAAAAGSGADGKLRS